MSETMSFGLVLGLLLPIAALGLSPVGATAGIDCPPRLADDFDVHAPISFTGDGTALAAGLLRQQGIRSGSGTADDPFVISEWHVQSEASVPALFMQDVSVYITIKHVTLEGRGAPAIVLENVVNLVFEDVDLIGPLDVYRSDIELTSARLVHPSVRIAESSVVADEILVFPDQAPGQYTITFVASSFDFKFRDVNDCTTGSFFGLGVVGGSDEGPRRITILDRSIEQVSVRNDYTTLDLELNTWVDFLHTTSEVSVHRWPSEPVPLMSTAGLRYVTLASPDASVSAQAIQVGNVTFLDTERAALNLVDSIWRPDVLNIPAGAVLDVSCIRSDLYLPARALTFELSIDADGCYLAGRTVSPGYVEAPHHGNSSHPQEAPSGLIMPAIVLVLALTMALRRKAPR